MKQIFLSIVMLFSVMAYSQSSLEKPKVIVDPSYEVKSSGIYNVAKIELSDTETRLTIHSTFIPHWWITFSKKDDMIRDSKTGKIYEITDIEGAELDQQIWMNDSGDSTIVLIYPPLDKGVQKIDFGTAAYGVYGISLDENKAGKRQVSTVPVDISKWINESLSKVTRKAPIDLNSNKFFNKGTGRLIGYIKGYDTRLGLTTGLVYTSNELTREDYPTVVQIHPDGRFEADLPLNYPKYSYVLFNRITVPFYLEPGQTLSMILDWEEFLIADRMRNIRYQFKNVVYQGPLAKVNTDLVGFTPDPFDYNLFQTKKGTVAPEEFKTEQLLLFKTNQQKVEDYIKSNTLSPQATSILRYQTLLENATHLFDFVMNRSYMATQDTANKMLKIPVTLTYYDFLKEMPLNDNGLLCANEFSTFVNRFEYCDPLSRGIYKNNLTSVKPKKDFFAFILESKVEISAEEKELLSLVSKQKLTEEEKRIIETKKEQIQAFTEKYKDQVKAYVEKYITPLSKITMARSEEDRWHTKDSVLRSDLGLENSLVYEITKIRSLKYFFESSSGDKANELWSNLKKGITNPFMIETGNLLYNNSFPKEKIAAYTLPKGTATDIFKKIVDPFKGKMLFIDFWATTCGPCVSGIKTMKPTREKYADNKDFEFIFITDERSSPMADYNKFVKEQGMKNIYRLSVDDYNYLRQLFKFNGIPHYTVIDQQGNVLSNNFPMHNFANELPRYLPNYSQQK